MSTRAPRWLATAAVSTALIAVIALGWKDRERFRAVRAGDEAPEFVLPDLNGDSVALSSLRGQVVLVNVWATWCPPCIWEMPAMERAYQELAGRGFEIVAVNVDVGSDDPARNSLVAANVRDYVNELGITFTVLRDPGGAVERAYSVEGLPTSFLIDRKGRIVHRLLGPAEWDQDPYRSMILELLES
ncbi:MAG TPA: TlpA disulfide reductase family protein [Longimicrobiales bacterium]|nr:TlpA disulfide reductase family protein [Longimicrobiales bacterium]